MICMVCGIPVYYEEYGIGKPVLSIHGWPVDHHIMSGCLEPVFAQIQGYRRIYLDLPGMGKTPPSEGIRNSDDMLEIVIGFVASIIGKESYLLIGESYGGRLALGLLSRVKEKVDGVFLLCASVDSLNVTTNTHNLPERQVILQTEIQSHIKENQNYNDFMEVAVIATSETFDRYVSDVLSGLDSADNEFLSNNCNPEYNKKMQEVISSIAFDKPSCILTGRQDHVVGYANAYELFERFSRATFAVLDCAGHNLQIENETLFSQFVKDWIWRVELFNIAK